MLLYLPPCTRGQAEGAPPPAPPGLSHAAAKRVCGKLGPEEVRGQLLPHRAPTDPNPNPKPIPKPKPKRKPKPKPKPKPNPSPNPNPNPNPNYPRPEIYDLISSTTSHHLSTRCAASCSLPRSSPCCGCSAARWAGLGLGLGFANPNPNRVRAR